MFSDYHMSMLCGLGVILSFLIPLHILYAILHTVSHHHTITTTTTTPPHHHTTTTATTTTTPPHHHHTTTRQGVPGGGHEFGFVPFGAGQRTCVGQRLAVMESTLILASLIKGIGFEFSRPGAPIEECADVTLGPKVSAVVERERECTTEG
jgi:hypothetical protein